MAEPRIGPVGTPEATWLEWPGLARLIHMAPCDLLTASRRLVVVAPHPDDELLTCGGLSVDHVDRGGRVLWVAVTDGEASHRGYDGWDAARLAKIRQAERATGLARLRLSNRAEIVRLELPDGGIAGRCDELVEFLARLLVPSDLAVTTWRGDAHPDHEATADALTLAARECHCGVLGAPVWMWHWASPADPRVPWDRLRAVSISESARRRKLAALDAHRSQLSSAASGRPPILDRDAVERAGRPFEYFFS